MTLAPLWNWVDQKNEAVGLLGKLLDKVAARRLPGPERTELVAAAHTVLVTSSFMEVFRDEIDQKYDPNTWFINFSGSGGQPGGRYQPANLGVWGAMLRVQRNFYP